MRSILLTLTAACWLFAASGAKAQGLTSTPGMPVVAKGTIDYSLGVDKTKSKSNGVGKAATRPDHVSNHETMYFPPIFNQAGGSCGACAGVAYRFCYEHNAYRGTNGKDPANYFPSHFTWLMSSCNSDEQSMLRSNGVPSAKTYGGQKFSKYFGNQDVEDPDFGWMTGYDKWYEAMFNRLVSFREFPIDVRTEEGRENVKRWLWNHNGDESFNSGGVCVIGVAAGPYFGKIENTAVNAAAGLVGRTCVQAWNHQYNHALTIVGYDDRVEFDLDSNGVFGEADKDELGAWIIANSWGQGWADGGFIYCPYKYGGPLQPWEDSYFRPSVYNIRKDYRPFRTLKVLMDYSKRTEICLSVGISADTTATTPDQTIMLEHFKYAGDGSKSGTDPDVPMLGKWADGMHYEPMEFGYDLTDLTANFDNTKPLKYFFIVNTKSKANGNGHIYRLSLMDYETQRDGVETPFKMDTVMIQNGGKTTVISMVIGGGQLFKPAVPSITGTMMAWQAPQKSSLELTGYYVYADGVLVDSVDAKTTQYDLAGIEGTTFDVAAVYKNNYGQLSPSAKAAAVATTAVDNSGDNQVYVFKEGSFILPKVFSKPMSECTIEWWMKCYTVKSWNQQIGPGWGSFLFHAKGGGGISVGWNCDVAKNRYDGSAALLKTGTWQHLAITVKDNVMILYINGAEKGRVTSSAYSGLTAFGDLEFGRSAGRLDAAIDELRVWKTCRTSTEIVRNRNSPIACPSAQPDLLAYYRMDKININGEDYLYDCVGGHHAQIIIPDAARQTVDNTVSLKLNMKPQADFAIMDAQHYAGEPVTLNSKHQVNVATWKWETTGAVVDTANTASANFVWNEPGEYTVKLTQVTLKDDSASIEKTITILPRPDVNVNFGMSTTKPEAGKRISFLNKTVGTCTYEWQLPGADEETIRDINASATYSKAGTYQVTLVATDAQGKSQSVTQTIEVLPAAPEAAFEVTPSTLAKGESVYLIDQSKYNPTSWHWLIEGPSGSTAIVGQNSSFTPSEPGIYNVKLFVKNEVGESSAIMGHAFSVSSANAGNCLTFGGNGQTMTFNYPFESTRLATISWWMNPSQAKNAMTLTSSDEQLAISTADNGAMTFKFATKKQTTPAGYVIAGEWHQYALSYSMGKMYFYRDGQLVTTLGSSASATPSFNGTITIGDATNGMTTRIDELRIYAKAATADILSSACNETIGNIEEAEQNSKLVLYYDFNHDTGNAIDRTSNGNTGVRAGFGPDGDAWENALGVFCISTGSPKQPTTITNQYMVNYAAPFKHTNERLNPSGYSGDCRLISETETSGWIIRNYAEKDGVIGGLAADAGNNYAMHACSGWYNFPAISNHILYQVVDLPAGLYRFGANIPSTLSADLCHLFATVGEEPVSITNIESTLAYTALADGTRFDFFLSEPTKVCLGINVNLSSAAYIRINSFYLQSLPLEVIEADGLTAIGNVTTQTACAGLQVKAEKGALTVTTTAGPQRLQVYTADGKCVTDRWIEGTTRMDVAKGIYYVKGIKQGIYVQ